MMDTVMLPETVEHYITKLQSSGNLQLTFKILDNFPNKTVVLTWRPPVRPEKPVEHIRNKPTNTHTYTHKNKSVKQQLRDKQRKVQYLERLKKNNVNHGHVTVKKNSSAVQTDNSYLLSEGEENTGISSCVPSVSSKSIQTDIPEAPVLSLVKTIESEINISTTPSNPIIDGPAGSTRSRKKKKSSPTINKDTFSCRGCKKILVKDKGDFFQCPQCILPSDTINDKCIWCGVCYFKSKYTRNCMRHHPPHGLQNVWKGVPDIDYGK